MAVFCFPEVTLSGLNRLRFSCFGYGTTEAVPFQNRVMRQLLQL